MNSHAQRYDIIVVGAGPAGSIAAQTAAMEGRRVCLVERKMQAGFPVRCGEGIGIKGAVFNKFDVDEKWIKRRINKIRLVAPDTTVVEVRQGAESYILDRKIMDLDLVQSAIVAGADYHCATTIRSVRRIEKQLYACASDMGARIRQAATAVLRPQNVAYEASR